MKKKEKMNIVFLLDRSGSMEGVEADTIGGYNNYINSQKKNNANVTTILFDDKYETLNFNTPIEKVKKLTRKEYYVRGSTALLDAIGKTIKRLDEEKKNKVIFIITTDGYENASVKYSKEEIKHLIKIHDNWEFVYIGADIDAFSEGQSLGISDKCIAKYEKSKAGIGRLYQAVSKISDMFCEEGEISSNWKDNL